jgi:hypothetical protein
MAARMALVAALLLSGRWAAAQTPVESFAQLQPALTLGQTVIVEDSSGSRIKGALTGLTATSMTVTPKSKQPRTFGAGGVSRVTRFDSRLNGFLIGAAAGAVPGLMLGYGWSEYCNNEAGGHCPVAYAIFGGLCSAVGGWIGWSLDGAINHDRFVVSVSRKF